LTSALFDDEEDSKLAGRPTVVGALIAGSDEYGVSSTNPRNNSDVDNDEYYCWLHVAWSKAHYGGRFSRCVEQSRRRVDLNDDDTSSLGYGEILPSSVWAVLRQWQLDRPEQQQQQQQSVRCVVDLGSGSGQALLAASLGLMWLQRHGRRQGKCRENQCCDSGGANNSDANDRGEGTRKDCAERAGDGPPLLKLVGIEIDPSWQKIALHNYQHVYGDCGSWTGGHRSDLVEASFVTGDFTASTDWWTRDADLVVCHATVFSENLMQATANACAKCRPGTRFLFVSKPLVHPDIETVRKGQLDMSWGEATVYLQKRI
jgi:SAM-dependent methyltransferase